MHLDVVGKVLHTPLASANGLHPLFEAIVNSIHAIEDCELATKGRGKIEISILRDTSQAIMGEWDSRRIVGFEITDNGCGFTKANYKSFSTSDSRLKIARGGKGVGRFLWLNAFDHVEVTST